MSIIDKIEDMEVKLQQIRKDGDIEIVNINNEINNKKQQMLDGFTNELETQKLQLNKEMLERVEAYKQSLQEVNIKEQLDEQYRIKQQAIITKICEDFWRE